MLKVIQEHEDNWYVEGLRFQCTGCGKCCTGAPGYVWVTPEEIIRMAHFLNITEEEFATQYLRIVDGRISLREMKSSYACVFLTDDNKCQIYATRPVQCQTFPWWPSNLTSIKAWKEAAQFCEGINCDAPLVDAKEIEMQTQRQATSAPRGP